MLLDLESETQRAQSGIPFSNGTEGQSWMSLWCEDCRHELYCPLVLVAMLGKTPSAWQERDRRSLNRYTCDEFEDRE